MRILLRLVEPLRVARCVVRINEGYVADGAVVGGGNVRCQARGTL